jgi:hypothetical protein
VSQAEILEIRNSGNNEISLTGYKKFSHVAGAVQKSLNTILTINRVNVQGTFEYYFCKFTHYLS